MRWLGVIGLAAVLLVSGCPEEAAVPLALGGSIDQPALRGAVVGFEAMRGASAGSEIVVAGSIGKVCPSGCWFYLHGPDDLVYVDVLGDWVVPRDAVGRKAIVRAQVDGEGGSRILKAMRVLLAP